VHGAEPRELRQTLCKRGKRTTTVYRWLDAVPLRATEDAIAVNWFSVEVFDAKGKRTYHNSFVTDLAVTADNIAGLAACGRARWKIENETFNVLKTNGYNLEHNYGHGKQALASVLVTLNLLAFAFHRSLSWRPRLENRGDRARTDLPLFRTSAHHHRLRGVPGLAPSASVYRRGGGPATLNRPHQSAVGPPKHGVETPKMIAKRI
jgi:hypothetical protein